jgi:hypothetical protein
VPETHTSSRPASVDPLELPSLLRPSIEAAIAESEIRTPGCHCSEYVATSLPRFPVTRQSQLSTFLLVEPLTREAETLHSFDDKGMRG